MPTEPEILRRLKNVEAMLNAMAHDQASIHAHLRVVVDLLATILAHQGAEEKQLRDQLLKSLADWKETQLDILRQRATTARAELEDPDGDHDGLRFDP